MPYPSHTQRTIMKVWRFASSSGNGTYETLQYNDLTTSCQCPGWTRRVDVNGNRSCKHTRMVHMGVADQEATGFLDYTVSPQQPNRKDTYAKERKDGSREVAGREIGKLGERKLL